MPDHGAVHRHSLTAVDGAKALGTSLTLLPYHAAYEIHCPKKTATIAAKIVGHFLPNFVSGSVPSIILIDGEARVDLNAFLGENIHKSHKDIIDIDGDEKIKCSMHHLLIDKSIQFTESGTHWLFLAANDRVVVQEVLDSQLGLKYVGDNASSIYVGIVTGDILDKHVNQERTGFTFSASDIKNIHNISLEYSKIFLKPYIDRIREKQIDATRRLIRENPQFIVVKDDIEEFVLNNLKLNTQSQEDIYLELSRKKRRARMRLQGQIHSLQKNPQEFIAKVEEVAKGINEEKKGLLAEYVVKRKQILDLMDSSLAFRNPDKRDYYKEEVVHDLIIPLGSSSDDLDYDAHNLWILDDRLAFYTYFKSDKQIRTFAAGSDSRLEPDLAVVYDQALAFEREGRDEPIVIIEFKRPGRDDYDGNSNPVSQVLKYVDAIKGASSLQDKSGKNRKPISAGTRFVCYVIADFTTSLVEVVRLSPAHHSSSDGEGFFGYSAPHNASVEVLPYSKLVHDARVRNEAFFAKLGLD